MDLRSIINTAVTVLLAVLIISIIASQLFGFPPPINYVGTDSMEPQLDPGDGFIGIPPVLAGDLSEGDVVTYEAQTIGGGGPTTHRIVDKTKQGYITKGDNNPFTDQEGDEPPVTKSQVTQVVLQIDGQIISIPFVGQISKIGQSLLGWVVGLLNISSVSATSPGIIIGLVGIVLVVFSIVYDVLTDKNSRPMRRSISRPSVIDSRLLLIGLLLVISLPLLSMTVLPSGTQELGIVSSESAPSDDRTIIQAGRSVESTMSVTNEQPVPMVIIIEGTTDDLEVYNPVQPAASGESVAARYRMWAPEEPGSYVRVRSVSFYFHVLPASVIWTLHSIHPVVAFGTTVGLILSPIVILFYLIVGFRQIPLRDTAR